MKKKIIIDTDPAMGTKGGDPEDCFAIMLAMNSPELEILGITTVQGNVPVERGFSNATYLVEQIGNDTPCLLYTAHAADEPIRVDPRC